MPFDVFFLVDDATAQSLLVPLALEDLFFDRTSLKNEFIMVNETSKNDGLQTGLTNRQQAVDETVFLLPVTPNTRHGLIVVGRVPIWVKHDKTIRSNQIQSATSRFAAQHEYPFGSRCIVERLDNLRRTNFMISSL